MSSCQETDIKLLVSEKKRCVTALCIKNHQSFLDIAFVGIKRARGSHFCCPLSLDLGKLTGDTWHQSSHVPISKSGNKCPDFVQQRTQFTGFKIEFNLKQTHTINHGCTGRRRLAYIKLKILLEPQLCGGIILAVLAFKRFTPMTLHGLAPASAMGLFIP